MAVAVALSHDDHLGDDGCDATLAAMATADPDLDPIWGLLVGACDTDGGFEIAPTSISHCKNMDKGPYETNVRPILVEEPESNEDEDILDSNEGRVGFRTDVATPAKTTSRVVDKVESSPAQFPLGEEDMSVPEVTRREVNGCDAFVLDGVLTQDECEQLIAQADGLWSFWDNAEKPRKEFRNACTVEVTHNELADRIWRRAGHLMNPEVVIMEDDERFEVDIEGEWKPYAMNPKLLLSRYLDGGHFSPHTDGTTVIDFNRRTF
jgi:hypothetical protein